MLLSINCLWTDLRVKLWRLSRRDLPVRHLILYKSCAVTTFTIHAVSPASEHALQRAIQRQQRFRATKRHRSEASRYGFWNHGGTSRGDGLLLTGGQET
jgi:hypothetical protein